MSATITLTYRQARFLQGVCEMEIDRANHEPDYDPADREALNALCDAVDAAVGCAIGDG